MGDGHRVEMRTQPRCNGLRGQQGRIAAKEQGQTTMRKQMLFGHCRHRPADNHFCRRDTATCQSLAIDEQSAPQTRGGFMCQNRSQVDGRCRGPRRIACRPGNRALPQPLLHALHSFAPVVCFAADSKPVIGGKGVECRLANGPAQRSYKPLIPVQGRRRHG